MLRIYLYRDSGKREINYSWQHETGLKILLWAKSLPINIGLEFSNISHSAGVVAVAISDYPVGVDIETKREVNPRIKNKAFSERELMLLTDKKNTGGILQLWTLKESYGKSKGVGIAYPLKTVEFEPATKRDDVWHEFICTDTSVGCYSHFTEDYVISVCVKNSDEGFPQLNLLQNDAWM